VLLTRSPLPSSIATRGPFDLHVLSTPPAFALSQDQTLQLSELLRVLSEFDLAKKINNWSLRFLFQRTNFSLTRERNLNHLSNSDDYFNQ
jgi:hypothetical protein